MGGSAEGAGVDGAGGGAVGGEVEGGVVAGAAVDVGEGWSGGYFAELGWVSVLDGG